MNNRRRLLIALGVLVSAIFLFFAFRNLKPEEFITSIQQVNIGGIVVAAVLWVAAMAVISLRWGYLLQAIQPLPLSKLVPLVCIGYMGNNVYPLRAGEALRVYLLWRNYRSPVAKTTVTVIVERILDGIVMVTFIVIALLLLEIETVASQQIAVLTLPASLGGIAFLIVLLMKPAWLQALTRLIVKFLPERAGKFIQNLSHDVVEGISGFKSPRAILSAIVTSYLAWLIEAVVYWVVMFAFGLELSYAVALLVVGVVNLSGLIPATPGQVGVYEVFAGLVLTAVGVSQSTATAYAIVVHIVIWLPVTLVGFYFLIQEGLGWSDVRAVSEQEVALQKNG